VTYLSHRRGPVALQALAQRLTCTLLGCALVLAAVGPCLALSPRTGDYALTGALGVTRTTDHDFDAAAAPHVSLDLYWSARNSLRQTLGLLKLRAGEASRRGSIRGLFFTVNVSHNWAGRRFLPFVTGGAGIYALDEKVAPDGGRDRVALGVNGGGGVEARLSDTLTLRLEGLLHALTGDGPSTVATASLGLKYYF
jgi:opacity protein-like surface antigen